MGFQPGSLGYLPELDPDETSSELGSYAPVIRSFPAGSRMKMLGAPVDDTGYIGG